MEEIIDFWNTSGIKVNKGVSEKTISAIETELQFVFPESFKKFYLNINGFEDWDTTYNLFYIWPIEKILEEYTKDDDKSFIPFCDFLIHSHWLGFIRDKKGIYKSYDKQTPIASTFEEAIELIHIDSELVY